MIRNRSFLASLVPLALVASSCTTTAVMYSGPRLPQEQVARLGTGLGIPCIFLDRGLERERICLREIDGWGIGIGNKYWEVLPGLHKLHLAFYSTCHTFLGYCRYASEFLIDFYAEAGHEYKLRGQVNDKGVNVWVEKVK